MGGKTHLVPYIWDREYLVCCQFYILQGLRGEKYNHHRKNRKNIPARKNITVIAFDKPISKILSSNTPTENMVSSHPYS